MNNRSVLETVHYLEVLVFKLKSSVEHAKGLGVFIEAIGRNSESLSEAEL